METALIILAALVFVGGVFAIKYYRRNRKSKEIDNGFTNKREKRENPFHRFLRRK